jgi:hypothetical protein
MKESFILHTNAWPAIERLPDEQLGRLFRAINLYAIGAEVPELDGATSMAFAFIAAQLDRDDAKYQAISAKRAEYGRRGGVAKATKSKQKLANVADNDNENDNENDNGNENDNDNDNINVVVSKRASAPTTTKTTAPRVIFKKPTLTEVETYCQERNNNVDPEGFVDYYEANGWKVGRSPMKDWKAAVRTWERKEAGRKKGGKSLAELAAEAVAEAEKEKQDNDEWWS